MRIFYCGPCMGKTYACSRSNEILDFDELSRDIFISLSNKLNMSVVEMKTIQHKEYVEKFISMMYYYKNLESNKILLVSNTIGLSYPQLFNRIYITSFDIFIHRNIKRGDTYNNSVDWYCAIINKITKLNRLVTVEDTYILDLLKKWNNEKKD